MVTENIVTKEDKGHVSDIRCQHPTCKTHPLLRYIYWVDGVPIGSVCAKKGRRETLEAFKEEAT